MAQFFSDDPEKTLQIAGQQADDEVSLFPTALAFGALTAPRDSATPYLEHLRILAEETASRYETLLTNQAKDTAGTQLVALKHVLHDSHGYALDPIPRNLTYSTNLIHTIDRRKGTPETLGILYLCTARALEWDMEALSFPYAFIGRIEKGPEHLLFDPAQGCKIMNAPDLRALAKAIAGPRTELSATYYSPLTIRALLIRLQNILKFHQIAEHEYESALITIHALQAFAPTEYKFFLESGVLYAKTGQKDNAILALETYITRAPSAKERYEAELFLTQLTDKL